MYHRNLGREQPPKFLSLHRQPSLFVNSNYKLRKGFSYVCKHESNAKEVHNYGTILLQPNRSLLRVITIEKLTMIIGVPYHLNAAGVDQPKVIKNAT